MRIVTVEEHHTVASLARRVGPEAPAARGVVELDLPSPRTTRGPPSPTSARGGSRRSTRTASPCRCCPTRAPAPTSWSRRRARPSRAANDVPAGAVAGRPGRLAGFAHRPLPGPAVTADEPARAVRERGFVGALPVSDADRERIAHGNADRLLGLEP